MPSIFDYVPWQLMAGGGVVLAAVLFGAVWYYTGSLKAALAAAATFGAAILLASAKKKGREEGIAAERQRQTEATLHAIEQKAESDETVRRLSPADRRDRLRDWSRDK